MKRHFVTFFFVLLAIAFAVLAAKANMTLASCTFLAFAFMSAFIAWFFEFGNIRD
jgi:hypothetical protein